MRRSLFPLLAVMLLGCPDEEDKSGQTGQKKPPASKTMEFPDEWQSRATTVAIRITNSTSTSTPTRRALTRIFNQRLDVGDMIMRGGLKLDPNGNVIKPGSGSDTTTVPDQHPEMLGGSAVDQARAVLERVDIDKEDLFPEGAAVDACGNPQLAAFLTPDVLQHVVPGDPTDLLIWPEEACGNAKDCNTLRSGVWDVGLSEMRYDGMLDLIIQVAPNTKGKHTLPAVWGHLVGYFLTENNPGFARVPLFANIRQVSISILGLLESTKMYFDPMGYREVYVFPHTERALSRSDVMVTLVGHDKCKDLWGMFFDHEMPFGCELALPLTLEMTTAGSSIKSGFMPGGDPKNLQQVVDTFIHQIGAGVSCPSVDEGAWIHEPPVEIFLCPDGNVDMCIAREDAEDFACAYLPLRDSNSDVGAPLHAPLGRAVVVGSTNPSSVGAGDTFTYSVDGGQLRTITAQTDASDPATIAAQLNTQATAGGHDVVFGVGAPGSDFEGAVLVQLASGFGPDSQLTIGSGSINSRLGFSSGTYSQAAVISGQDPYLLYPPTGLGGSATGYIAIQLPEGARLYTDEPDRVRALYASNGSPLDLPDAQANGHCVDDGPARFHLGDTAGNLVYVEITGSSPIWIMPTDPGSWIP